MGQSRLVLIAITLSACSSKDVASREQPLTGSSSSSTPLDGGVAPLGYSPSEVNVHSKAKPKPIQPLKALTDGVTGVGVVLCNSTNSRFADPNVQNPETILTDYSIQVTDLLYGVLPST